MADRLRAAVVGGGIAGLASAVSLAQAGWRTTVLERAPVFGEVGAGLAITRNGMTALDAIGVGERSIGTGTSDTPRDRPSMTSCPLLALTFRPGVRRFRPSWRRPPQVS